MKIKTTIMFDEAAYTQLKNFAHKNNESIGTVVRTAVDYLLKGKIVAEDIPQGFSSSTTPSISPSLTETPDDDGTMPPFPVTPREEVKQPSPHLSGKVSTCTFCHESVPVELALKHYNSKHDGL